MPQEDKEKEDMVAISKKQLTTILKKLDRLESAADKNRLQNYDDKTRLPELPRVKINVYEDPKTSKQTVIVGWKTLKDEVFVDTYGMYHETQIVELILEDESTVEVKYQDIVRRVKKQEAELIKREKDNETGYEIFELRRLSDGKVYRLDSRFIN